MRFEHLPLRGRASHYGLVTTRSHRSHQTPQAPHVVPSVLESEGLAERCEELRRLQWGHLSRDDRDDGPRDVCEGSETVSAGESSRLACRRYVREWRAIQKRWRAS